MNTLPYLINFSLGDWSGDGHAIHEQFLIESNLPVEELRELHFKFQDLYNIDIGSICREYSSIPRDLLDSLILIGVLDSDILLTLGTKNYYVSELAILLDIWLKCLKAVNPEFVWDHKIVPNMHFSGVDDKNRHLQVPGYGLFD